MRKIGVFLVGLVAIAVLGFFVYGSRLPEQQFVSRAGVVAQPIGPLWTYFSNPANLLQVDHTLKSVTPEGVDGRGLPLYRVRNTFGKEILFSAQLEEPIHRVTLSSPQYDTKWEIQLTEKGPAATEVKISNGFRIPSPWVRAFVQLKFGYGFTDNIIRQMLARMQAQPSRSG